MNGPSAVIGCHRHRLVETLTDAQLPFPVTAMTSTAPGASDDLDLPDGDCWVKRGDVHAQEAADVQRCSHREVWQAIEGFRLRGVARVAVQQHIEGPVLKFYGVSNGSLFHAFREDGRAVDGDTVDMPGLRTLAFAAARAVGLHVFGGDAVVASRSRPMLVDLNDWPSFAPVRDAAAIAIAELAQASIMQRSTR